MTLPLDHYYFHILNSFLSDSTSASL
uniref:Uncharacterized protein n=1 Tax=Arundo donax TaxID=35708 RepID=A0A0A9CB22_ARUDO